MKKKIINSPGVPNIIDISSNRLKEDNSLLNIINNNNYIDNLKLNRNKSAKQMNIIRNIVKKIIKIIIMLILIKIIHIEIIHIKIYSKMIILYLI